jgi:signal transduction histidine kinase
MIAEHHEAAHTRAAVLDELTGLAAAIFQVPVATVSLIGADGVRLAGHTGQAEADLPRVTALCRFVAGGRPLIMPDTTAYPALTGAVVVPRFFAGHPVTDPDGRVLGAFCLLGDEPRGFALRDLEILAGLAGQAARHLAALSQGDELARVVTREQDLVSAVSHEMRTPVTVIQGYLEALGDEEQLAPYRGMLDKMGRNGDRLVRMIDHLLAGADPDDPVVTLPPGHLDLASVAQVAVGACLPLARQRDVHIRLEVAGDPLPVRGDFGDLCQAADQLLRNAVAFSGPGAEVLVRVTDHGGPCLEVVDRGAGVPAGELPYLRERFYRGRYAREHAVPGVGLGLNIADRIVAAHGGTLTISSDGPGRGTSVRLSMPARRESAGRCTTRRGRTRRFQVVSARPSRQ